MRYAWLLALLALTSNALAEAASPRYQRGLELFQQGGCASCHSGGTAGDLAGGIEIKTPFGVFHSTNISADVATGIGSWSEADFIRALQQGVAPDGSRYYPAFPYEFYRRIPEDDLKDLFFYLQQQPAVSNQAPPHELAFPFNQRWLLGLWQWLFATQAIQTDPLPQVSEGWRRGEYLVNGPGHCAACHAPRGAFGHLLQPVKLSGVEDNGVGETIPPIISSARKQPWEASDLDLLLQIGMMTDGDFVGGHMGLVIENTSGQWSEADRAAVVEFLISQ